MAEQLTSASKYPNYINNLTIVNSCVTDVTERMFPPINCHGADMNNHSRANNVARFIIRGVKARFRDEKTELQAILDHVSAGDTVCDVGANKGSFTFWLARWCRKGRVVSFEPQLEIADTLAADCRALGFSNVTVEPMGVYSQSGMQTLHVPIGHSPGASVKPRASLGDFTSVTIPVVALDEYFSERERVSVLKIDVEGAEQDVLKGAERILRTSSPLLIIECEGRHGRDGAPYDVFRFLGSLGYTGHFGYRREILPIEAFDPSIHQRADGEWFWKQPDYCNNFIFHGGRRPDHGRLAMVADTTTRTTGRPRGDGPT